MRKMLFVVCGVAVSAALFGESAVHVYALPKGEPRCDLYRVSVDGVDVPVSSARVSAMPVNIRWPGHQREKDQTEISGFVHFEMSRPVTMTVERVRDFKEVRIRPCSKGVACKRNGRAVSFTLVKPGDYSVEFDGRHENLHVFAQPPSAYAVKKDSPKVRYFGPGVHDVGLVEMKSGETFFIDEGAVVYGRVFARDADDIHIVGRGILDASRIQGDPIELDPAVAEEQRRKGWAITNIRRYDCVRLMFCNRVRIEGITIRDSEIYAIRPICCQDLAIENVKIIGSWRYNSDGIDMHNCRRVRISRCFIRTFDDSICVKGFDYCIPMSEMTHNGVRHDIFEDVLVEKCVIWTDWGRSLEIGAETRGREIRNITFRDCDIIWHDSVPLDVQLCDEAHAHHIVYDDIRVEYDADMPTPVLAEHRSDYRPQLGRIAPLAVVEVHYIPEYSLAGAENRGRASDITFRNISVFGPSLPGGRLSGFDADHRVERVSFENVRLNGVDVTDAFRRGVERNAFVGETVR